MNGKTSDNKQPKFAGLDEINYTSAEENQPTVYFAGVAKLSGYPLMDGVITEVTNTPSAGGKK